MSASLRPDEDLSATVVKAKDDWRNATGRDASIITSNGDYLAPSLGALVYDARANRINHRADELFVALLRDDDVGRRWLSILYAYPLDDDDEERRAKAMAEARHKRVRVLQRFDERPDPTMTLAIAVEAEELRQAAGGKRQFRATKEQTDARRWALYDIVV
jgi:hypothetical protein